MSKSQRPLRSTAWFGREDKDGFLHRSWMRNQGLPSHLFDGRPVIGICNTFSELTPCNGHFRGLAERVKRGVYEAGGLPLRSDRMGAREHLGAVVLGGVLLLPGPETESRDRRFCRAWLSKPTAWAELSLAESRNAAKPHMKPTRT